jgi:hypothetical protein
MTRHGVMAINTKPAPPPGAAVDEALAALIGQFLTTTAGCAKAAGIKTTALSGTTLCSSTLRIFEQMDRSTAMMRSPLFIHGFLRDS